MTVSKQKNRRNLVLATIACTPIWVGCGGGPDGGEVQTTSGSDTGGDAGGDPNPADGPDCAPDVDGYQLSCFTDGYEINIDGEEVFDGTGLEYSDPSWNACCAGCAPISEMDDQCQGACVENICEQARNIHLSMVDGWDLCFNSDCGFDMAACETAADALSGIHTQCIEYIVQPDECYELDVSCDASQNSTIDQQSGCVSWADNAADELPAACSNGDGTEFDNFRSGGAAANGSGSGNTATTTYTYDGSSAVESSTSVITDLIYSLEPCVDGAGGAAKCLSIEKLELVLPTLTIEGVATEDATITVERVNAQPVVDGSGNFSYAAGDIEATLRVDVGTGRYSIPRENIGTVTGQLSPAANSFSISDLSFDYEDSLIDAELEIDVLGDYVNRAPVAAIAIDSEGPYCSDPVVFEENTTDPDGDSLTHSWTVLGGTDHDSGTQFSVVLSSGDHRIALFSTDGDAMDTKVLSYTRTCRP